MSDKQYVSFQLTSIVVVHRIPATLKTVQDFTKLLVKKIFHLAFSLIYMRY